MMPHTAFAIPKISRLKFTLRAEKYFTRKKYHNTFSAHRARLAKYHTAQAVWDSSVVENVWCGGDARGRGRWWLAAGAAAASGAAVASGRGGRVGLDAAHAGGQRRPR